MSHFPRHRFERLLFLKLELWLVLLTLTICVIGTVLFAALVKNHAEQRRSFGVFGEAAYRIANIPGDTLWTLRRVRGLRIESPYLANESDIGGSGLTFHASPGTDGYLLISRYDVDTDRALVELIDLDRGETVHSWQPALDLMAARARTQREHEVYERLMIPYVWPDGSLTVSMHASYVAMVDRCSNVRWVVGTPPPHHSVETDADGFLWVPYGLNPPSARERYSTGLAKMSRTGEVVSLIQFEDVLRRNGYHSLFYAMDSVLDDPLHLNDIQPVLRDGPYWRRGDLFISLRTHSVVLLYRPSSDEVVWLQTGPWLHQHDVNIVSNHEISVFSNNVGYVDGEVQLVLDASDVFIYDFETGKTRSPWRDALADYQVRTETQGRATMIDEDTVFVEESDYGRALSLSADGELHWTYVNRGTDGEVYQLSWSRYLPADEGDRIAEAVSTRVCP
ncbi:MAG: hypothetical protein F4Y45_04470 [Acidobacteria bacterium]|nr:hypothetical protein [Acidobacteriota bacterium]MYJ06022.1 hypothetical protein [Acidobacteriota bacterium]